MAVRRVVQCCKLSHCAVRRGTGSTEEESSLVVKGRSECVATVQGAAPHNIIWKVQVWVELFTFFFMDVEESRNHNEK